jgi:apolipoprotein N-acyltransferase
LDFPFLAFALQEIGRFTPGTNQDPLLLPDGTALGILICYEAIFQGLAVARAASGAQVFVNISNDARFGRSPAMLQHLQQAVMRSVEQRHWLLRSTTNGLTTFVDAGGRITALGPSHVAAFVANEFTPRSGLTIFNRISPFIAPSCAIVLLLAFLRRGHYIRQTRPAG